MQDRKIDCKLTRQRNQSSSPKKRLISLQFFISYFLRCGNSNKKNLRAVTKTTETTWAEGHWGFESLSYSICQPKLPGTRQTPRFFTLFGSSAMRRVGACSDLHAAGVYASCVYLCVMWLSCHLKLSPIPKSAVSRPFPCPLLAAPIRERWLPSCASGAARCTGLSRHYSVAGS